MHQHVATPPQMMCHFVATMVLILVEAMVRGYHVYKDTWATAVGEQLPSQRQDGNFFAVAVVREEVVRSKEDIISLLSLSNTGAAQLFVE